MRYMYWVISALALAAGSANAQLPGVDAPTGSRGAADSARSAAPPVAPAKESPNVKDPLELCQKLAGNEREICVRQSKENRTPTDPRGTGSTPGSGRSGAI